LAWWLPVRGALFEALAGFRRAHPEVDITLTEDTSDRMVDRFRDRSLDLALIGWASTPPADLGSLPIVSDRQVAVVGLLQAISPWVPIRCLWPRSSPSR